MSTPNPEPLVPPVGRARTWLRAHERGVDIALAVAVLVTSLINTRAASDVMVVPPSAYGPAGRAVIVVSALAAAAAVVIRRRRPLVAAYALTASVAAAWPAVHQLASIAVIVAAYTAARYASTRQAAGWLATQYGVTLVVSTLWSPVLDRYDPPAVRADAWFSAALLALAAWAIGLLARRTRTFEDELLRRAARHAQLRSALAVADERRRIAGELHDVVSHSLTVMVNLSDGALATRAHDPELAWRAVEQAAATGRAAAGEMTALLGVLRADDDAAPTTPTAFDLDSVVAAARAAGLPVTLTIAGPAPGDPTVQLAVRRIVQESLTNTLKHAVGATGASVRLETTAGQLVVRVTDDGHGVVSEPRATTDPAMTSGGYGILGLRERVGRLGGSLDAGPAQGGWLVSARIPLPPAPPTP